MFRNVTDEKNHYSEFGNTKNRVGFFFKGIDETKWLNCRKKNKKITLYQNKDEITQWPQKTRFKWNLKKITEGKQEDN